MSVRSSEEEGSVRKDRARDEGKAEGDRERTIPQTAQNTGKGRPNEWLAGTGTCSGVAAGRSGVGGEDSRQQSSENEEGGRG